MFARTVRLWLLYRTAWLIAVAGMPFRWVAAKIHL